MKRITVFRTESGKEPYTDWLYGLKDKKTRQRIIGRVFILGEGHYGDYRSVGQGVYELRFFFGPGYRIYFAEHGDEIIVLLVGGDKGSQRQDIERAHSYWREFLER